MPWIYFGEFSYPLYSAHPHKRTHPPPTHTHTPSTQNFLSVDHQWNAKAFVSQVGDWGSIPCRDRPETITQVVRAPLQNARQHVWVLRVLGDDHYYVPCYIRRGTLKNTSLLNDQRCVNIKKLSPSSVMVTSPYEWKITICRVLHQS